jgi:[acyl-carrier-protein] S-malonyltransferase
MTNTQIAIVFPGQGSQSVGMLAGLAENHPVIRETFDLASKVLGYDLWALTQQGPEAELGRTDRTQPAMLAADIAVWRLWRQRGGAQPSVMAGHSLGEYAALVAAEALSFEHAVALVAKRGEFMQEAVPAGEGAMAALLGLDDDRVRQICAEAAQEQVVSAVNFNSPGQVVIAGNATAVERAIALAREAGAKRAVVLPVSVPSHCALMKPAAERMRALLEQTPIASPRVPVLHNADVQTHSDAAAIRDALVRQLYNPVRWVESVSAIAARGARTVLELGPGKVLTGLNKRIERELTAACVQDEASLQEALALPAAGAI